MENENKMIILNNMYTGRYITQQGKLGHEAINLFKADNGKFYIWLNSMGVCTKSGVEGCTVIMVRSINSKLYKVIAKAENCQLCKGADISRKKGNEGTDDKKARYKAQKEMKKTYNVTYNGKDPMDNIYNEEDMFATFWTKKVYETKSDMDVYLTNDKLQEDSQHHIYYVDFSRISEAMRAYIGTDHNAYDALSTLLDQENIWNEITENNTLDVQDPKSKSNFFKLLGKERDELAFSNALAHFIGKAGIDTFLKDCLKLKKSFLKDKYELLREKNNIDISFWGEKNVVIIENKIDSNITVDNRKTLESQIRQAMDLYFEDISGDDIEKKSTAINNIIRNYKGNVSQLSKYYIYAVAYLLSKGVDESKIEDHIKCFLLIPKYAQYQFKNKNSYFDSPFLLAYKYKIITYEDIYNFFKDRNITDDYYKGFVLALDPLKNEFNNELEKEMKYRFLRKIGKI